MTQGGSNKKAANRLVGASCAAVLAVYTAGYDRTQSAANRLAAQVAERRAAVPVPERVTLHVPGLQSPALIPVPARPLPQDRGTPDKEAERVEVNEPASIEPPEPLEEAAQVTAPPVNPVPTPVSVPSIPPAASKPSWKDGTYTGWGYSRHGNIEATIVIDAGRILSANISQCRTRYSCDVIDKLIPQVAQRQSPDVDYVSGATQSADAFYGAVVEALSKAK